MLDSHDALQLIDFDLWANARTASALAGCAPALAPAERLFGHLVGAHELWFERVRGEKAELGVWPEGHTLAELLVSLHEIAGRWRAYLEQADANELVRVVRFQNLRGEPCADPVDAIVRHLAHHGTHHRAQIATLLREAGHKPENLDYISWWRHKRHRAELVPVAWKHFVIESSYLADLGQIDEKLAAHRAHLESGYQSGMLLASGPQVPRTGGMILARARERSEIEEFLAVDPFARAGLAKYRVIEFQPVKQAPSFSGWATRE